MHYRRTLTAVAAGIALGAAVACGTDGGLLGGEAAVVVDPAESFRRQGDFLRAEDLLEARLAENKGDAEAYKILGDVKVSRAQNHRKKWAVNLTAALEAYWQAVVLEPTECRYWGRLAFAVAAAAEDDQVGVDRAILDGLPLETGWFECPGAAMVILEENRLPTTEELAAAGQRLGGDATQFQLAAATMPSLVEGYKRIDTASLEWKPGPEPLEPAEGQFFVVLEGPVQARSQAGTGSREIMGPEWMTIAGVDGSSVVFLDTKVRSRTRVDGVVKAGACPGTSWSLGPDGRPLGYCVEGPYNARNSRVYDPARLEIASVSHYDQPTLEGALVPGSTVVQGSVKCLGGAVGRLFVDEATCRAEYYRASALKRLIPAQAGLVAATQEEAERMVHAYGSGALYGAALGKRLARGEHAVGLPFSLWAHTRLREDLHSCTGRRLLQRAWFAEDAVEFVCTVGRRGYHFRDFVYLGVEVESQ